MTSVIDIPVFNTNSVDPDQTPHSAASDLGLHSFRISMFWDSLHKWIMRDQKKKKKKNLPRQHTSFKVTLNRCSVRSVRP